VVEMALDLRGEVNASMIDALHPCLGLESGRRPGESLFLTSRLYFDLLSNQFKF
jgi:hypothetical protein